MIQSRLSIKPAQVFLFALLFGPTLLGGCSQSVMTDMWRDPAYNDGAMKKVLTVAVRKDPVRRRIWEDAFVRELQAHGVSAVASYSAYPSNAPDSSQISDMVQRDGYDGVAISVRLPDVIQESYVAGYTKREPVTISGPFLHEYTTFWRDVQVPGYTETNQVRRFQTNLWTTHNGGRMIWSGTVETTDTAAHGPVRKVIRKLTMTELVNAGIIPPGKK